MEVSVAIYIYIFSEDSSICSIHGLIRGENMELGRDSDTGGQVHNYTSRVSS